MLQTVLMVFQIIVCVAMVVFVLLQQSEGGALGMGGGPTGFMSARGAGDLLTRITWILFSVFLLISVSLTWLTAREQAKSSVIDRVKTLDLNQQVPTAPKPLAPAPINPLGTPDLAPPSPTGLPVAPPATSAPAPAPKQ